MKQKLTIRKDTSSYTLDDIQKEIIECKYMLIELGYKDLLFKNIGAKLNKRSVEVYGSCKKLNDRNYIIQINYNFLKVGKPENVHNTIMHEMCHVVDGCMNHGKKWKDVAAKVNKHYNYTKIERIGDDENYKEAYLRADKKKYTVKCTTCGKEWGYGRACKVVKLVKADNAVCPYCKDDKFILIQNF